MFCSVSLIVSLILLLAFFATGVEWLVSLRGLVLVVVSSFCACEVWSFFISFDNANMVCSILYPVSSDLCWRWTMSWFEAVS